MRIAAWSDGHGSLPKLEKTVDVVIIAGDIMPLHIQRQTNESIKWFANDFFKYIKKLPCKKVFFVPGNHDFLFENISPKTINDMISQDAEISNKLIYLLDEEYEYKGYKFYGTPWVTGPSNWAFYTSNPEITYNHIPDDTNILICHQPPKIDKIGCSYPYQPNERNFGSDNLTRVIEDNENIKYVFCGHIHSGIHDGIQYDKKMIYNVSIKDEDYEDTYNVTYIEI